MLTICGILGSALDGDDHLAVMRMRDTHQLRELLEGACEDDCEVTAPFIGMCPDESDHEDGSPITYGSGVSPEELRAFDESYAQMMAQGFDFSTTVTIASYRTAHGRDVRTGEPIDRHTPAIRWSPWRRTWCSSAMA